jgi:hypothetical protein
VKPANVMVLVSVAVYIAVTPPVIYQSILEMMGNETAN